MTNPFNYSTTYVLDKSHFSETFDASVPVNNSKSIYTKSIVMGLAGAVVLIFTDINAYIAWFIVALGAVEALSVRFRKPWWLARQMISKAANTRLTLTINDEGVSTESFHVTSKILWADISKIEATDQGWLLHTPKGKSYLSNRCLSEEAQAFVQKHA